MAAALLVRAAWLLATALPSAQADEGMWLPSQLPELAPTLKQQGLALDVDELADPQGSVLGAIVMLGGCTGSFVSPDGLIATNHHCVMGYLQRNSTGAHDITISGYTAATRDDELPAGAGAHVWVLQSEEVVTEAVLAGIGRKTRDRDRKGILDRNKHGLLTACEDGRKDRYCSVKGFYGGSEYRLQRYLQLQDLRLVYAPAERVGDYGGDVDNWMWPRHSGDFALMRAYVAPDGSSAPPADDNVPYRPRHHLKVDRSGAAPGDFVMVAGYPGSTRRHATLRSLVFHAERFYPFRIALYDELLGILRAESEASKEARAKLARPISYLENSHKLSRGMLDNFERSDVIEKKKTQEAALRSWLAQDRRRARTVGAALLELDRIEAVREASFETEQLGGWLLRGSDLLGAAHRAWRVASEAEKPDAQRDSGYHQRDLDRHRHAMERLQQGLWLPAERALLDHLLRRVLELEGASAIPEVDAWVASHGSIEGALDALFAAAEAEGGIGSTAGRLALLDQDAATLGASEDPWIQFAIAMDGWQAKLRARDKVHAGARIRLAPVRMQALLAAQEGPTYDDANRTLRLTTGHVAGYSPQDGVLHVPQTTSRGVLAKVGPSPFDAPEDLVAALPTAPESRWADAELGDLPVDFLTTLDTTGGNSGSPTLNARGELVGLIFDGVWESMSADWIFDPELTRSIHVDVRYLLWMLESVDQGTHLLDELLGSAPTPPPPPPGLPAEG
jgi:hypothetical protein